MICHFSALREIKHVSTVTLSSAAAALLTIPPAFPSEIISEHAWQKPLAALKHVSSTAQGLWRRAAAITTTLRPVLYPEPLFAQGLNASY